MMLFKQKNERRKMNEEIKLDKVQDAIKAVKNGEIINLLFLYILCLLKLVL